ncbi:MAG: histidine kinase [Rhodothermaceae bacterium]|nr:histidine kinase [Rhodothermaceae bacterium]
MSRSSTVLILFFIWTLFFILYTLHIAHYAGDTFRAIQDGLWTTGTAAGLSMVIWWISGLLPWPNRIRLSFLGRHFLITLFFVVAWTAISYLRPYLFYGTPIKDIIRAVEYLEWYILIGFLLYLMIAGGCYSIRNQQRMRELERIANRAETLLAQAKLQTLRAQLNPHFLFNALHSLSTLIRPDPDRAEHTIEQLGDLLRYTLDEKDSEAVTLQDEWAFTHDYLALQCLRYGQRLRIETDIEEDSLACLVPPFTLQPLVENAVEHCVAEVGEGATISIRAKHEAPNLILSVQDDGPGAELSSVWNAQGLGINTLKERIQALYGSHAELDVKTSPGEGFCATLKLPAMGPLLELVSDHAYPS